MIRVMALKRQNSLHTFTLCLMVGRKYKPLLIGKTANPIVLKDVNMDKIVIIYRSQPKAWMAGTMFAAFMKKFYKDIQKRGKKALTFLDNAGVHNAVYDLDLKAVKVVMLPKNTTGKLQLLDAGIMQSFKLLYRKELHRFLTTK